MNKPSDSVRVVIFDQNNPSNFLVLTETDDPDNWKLPGGKFDTVTENPTVAANREVREELSATLKLEQVAKLVNDDGESARYIFMGSVAAATIEPTREIDRTDWVTEKTIPQSPNQRHILSAVQAARSYLQK